MDKYIESLNERYVVEAKNKFAGRLKIIERAQGREKFGDISQSKLAILLENTDRKFSSTTRILESNYTSDFINGLKTQYFDIVSAVFPGLLAEDLFSVQPIQQRQGMIFYLRYVYGSDKGHIKKGDTVFSQRTMAGYENSDYSQEAINGEPLFTFVGAETNLEAFAQYTPITPGSFKVEIGSKVFEDNGEGLILDGSTEKGTINYESGEVSFEIAAATAGAIAVADYAYSMEMSGGNIPQVDIRIEEQLVYAQPRKLIGRYSLDAGFDLQQAQGIDIQKQLLEAAANQLRHEIDGELIMDAFNKAQGTVVWNAGYDATKAAINKADYYTDFIDVILEARQMIFDKTKRVSGNWVVCGTEAARALRFVGAPRFEAVKSTNAGPRYAGMLEGDIAVYENPFFNPTDFLVGYKGDNLLDAGLVYAPYLPFFATNPTMLEDFIGRQGFASTYGKKMINADLYVKGSIVK